MRPLQVIRARRSGGGRLPGQEPAMPVTEIKGRFDRQMVVDADLRPPPY
jgi:hypothetical protein